MDQAKKPRSKRVMITFFELTDINVQFLSLARSLHSLEFAENAEDNWVAEHRSLKNTREAGRHDAGASCSRGENLRYQNKLACSDPSSTPLCILSDPYTNNARISSLIFICSVTSVAL